jgi:hypothetical protein
MTKDRGTDADGAFVASRRDLGDKEIWNPISVREDRELEGRVAGIMVKETFLPEKTSTKKEELRQRRGNENNK